MFYRILTAILPDFVLLKIRYFLRALIGYEDLREGHGQLTGNLEERLRRVEGFAQIAKQKFHQVRAFGDTTRDTLRTTEQRLRNVERQLNIPSEEIDWESISIDAQTILTHTPILSESELGVVPFESQELFRGGIYNPGALQRDGEILLVGRGELHSEKERSHDPALVRRGSTPVVAICSYDGHVKSEYQLELESFDDMGNLRTEDYRLFTFYQGLYASHPIIRFPGDFPLSRPTISQAISRVDLQQKRLSYVCEPKLDRQIMSQEKNWVYLEHDRELYLFYMFYPDFVVNKFVYGSDWEFKTVVDE